MMYNAGVVTGFTDGSYKPNESTLREQVIGMINTLIVDQKILHQFLSLVILQQVIGLFLVNKNMECSFKIDLSKKCIEWLQCSLK